MAADPEWLIDLFEPFGVVRLKRMFSGYGVYAGDFCIALALNPGLCMRVDDETRAAFEAAGALPFTYAKQGKTITVQKWWRLPDEMVDDPDEIARWAQLSLEVARRLPPKKKRPPKKLSPKSRAVIAKGA
ncbi:MAG: DNA transformation [Beijerinckiaceae bacterium]|nr:MAG: DNA transformation [Beijerinckiaceae bacterium]